MIISFASCESKDKGIVKKDMTILFTGDSITHDWRTSTTDHEVMGVPWHLGHPQQIKDNLEYLYPDYNLKFLNTGIGGDTFAKVYARCQTDIIDYKPDIVIMLLGVNEIWGRANDRDGIYADADKLFKKMHDDLPNTIFYICEPFVFEFDSNGPQYRANVKVTKDVVKELAQKYQMNFVPLDDILNTEIKASGKPYGDFFMENIHPVTGGYNIISREILKAMGYEYLTREELELGGFVPNE